MMYWLLINDIFVSVAVDRRYDRNSDTGRFELAYKQPMVAQPPYIGINLTVEGQSIRKPAPCARKSCEALVANDHKDTKSPVEESSADDKSSTEDDRKENEQPDSNKTEKKEKDSHKQTISKSPGVHSMQNNVHRSSNNSPSSSRVINLSAKSSSTINALIDPSVIKTIVASPAGLYSSQSVSNSMPSSGAHVIPFPPSRTKASFTPLQIMNNARRAITRGSVGTNTLPSSFSSPTTMIDKLDKVAPPATTSADTTDTKHRGNANKWSHNPDIAMFRNKFINAKSKPSIKKLSDRQPKVVTRIKFPQIPYVNYTNSEIIDGNPRLKYFNLSTSVDKNYRLRLSNMEDK